MCEREKTQGLSHHRLKHVNLLSPEALPGTQCKYQEMNLTLLTGRRQGDIFNYTRARCPYQALPSGETMEPEPELLD